MNDIQHRDLAAGRWWELSLFEQLGNIGSEISRAVKWSGRNDALARGAFERALELFDLTLDDPRHRQSAARLRELARAREVVVDFFDGANEVPLDGVDPAEVLRRVRPGGPALTASRGTCTAAASAAPVVAGHSRAACHSNSPPWPSLPARTSVQGTGPFEDHNVVSLWL